MVEQTFAQRVDERIGRARACRIPRRRRVSQHVRRRRQVLAGVVMALIVPVSMWALRDVAGLFGDGPLAVPGPALIPAAASWYVAQPGDTVWSIARQADPHGEIRPVVDELMSELHGQVLQPGDRLELPALSRWSR